MISKVAGAVQGRTGVTVREFALTTGTVAVFTVAVSDLLPIIGAAT